MADFNQHDNEGIEEDHVVKDTLQQSSMLQETKKVKNSDNNNIYTISDAKQSMEDKVDTKCGWGPWKPAWAQVFNNPKGYLILLSFQGLIQGMIAFGFLYACLTTLEKRFNLSSTSTGLLASCYDIAGTSVIIFVTYFGERGNKPAWVGWGGLVFAIGSVVFSLPHFLTGDYDFEVTEFDVCDANRTISEECDPSLDSSSLSKYLAVFIVGNLLMGFGAAPLYTLGVAYMDENIMPDEFGLYMGIFNAACGLGPAIGYLVGGVLLNVYTDILVDKNDLTITPDSPVWVGAWWLGFIVVGAMLFTSSLFFVGFPSTPPGATEVANTRKSEAQSGAAFKARQGTINNLKDFPLALWKLFQNVPFMMLTGAATTEWFMLSGLGVFAPKYTESQFNLSASITALYTGVITLIAGVVGSIVGGWLVKKFKLGCLGQLKLCFILVGLSLLFASAFVIYCDEIPFAGVTVEYGTNSSVPVKRGQEANITAPCNQDCNCEALFDPVCGADNVMYYTACHAGCHVEIESEGIPIYKNCTCVMESYNIPNDIIHAEGGRCDRRCKYQWVFMILMLCMLTVTFAAVVPAWTATMRCVSHSQRAFGLGIQTVVYALLGTIPGPIVYGLFIDKSCLIWEYTCDGYATCWLYDNKLFAHSFLLVTLVMKILSLIFFAVAIFCYKPSKSEILEQDLEPRRESGIELSLSNDDVNRAYDVL